jgi:hypothetical protein
MRWTILSVTMLLVAGLVIGDKYPVASAAGSSGTPAATSTAEKPASGKPAATSTAPATTSTSAAAATPTATAGKPAAKAAKAVAVARPKIEFQNASVRQVLDYVAEIGRFNIVYDKALEDAGIDLAAIPVSIRISGLSFDDVLNLVLPAECGYKVENGYVLVTTLQRSWLPLPVCVYDIRMAMAEIPDYGAMAPKFNIANIGIGGAVGNGGAGGGGMGTIFTPATPAAPPADKVTPEKIIDLVKTFVKSGADRRIAPWTEEGGPATIKYLNGHLIVSQTPAGHAAVLRIITMIE